MTKTLLRPFVALVTGWNKKNDYQQARWKLTGLYLVILFIILNIFTVSLFFILQKEEKRHTNQIEVRWKEQKITFPRKDITIIELTNTPQKFEKSDLLALQHTFLQVIKQWIIILEGVLLFLAGVMSYFLSGKTLKPIQKKNEQQKQFLADVSHELKNPLSALKMTLAVSKKQKKWKQGEVAETMTDIDTEISRLITITENLLTLEKYNKSKKQKKQNIASIIKPIIEKCLPIAQTKNIKITKDISDFIMSCDRSDLEKVIFNILHNALKFSFPSSEVRISLSSTGRLEVRDFGIGISQKDLPHIFERFYKVDQSRTFTDENGSGLGLSLVKKICDENKWTLSLKSRIKKGTTIIINFI